MSEMHTQHVFIKPQKGLRFIDLKELTAYRDLFKFLVWRSVKVRYAQSTLGIGWAIIQPVFTMLVFTIIFGRLAKIESNGVPYAIFSFTALVPWTYFSNALNESTSSLIAEANMMSKVYFPRVILPLAAVLAKLVDFGISFILLLVLMAWFGSAPTAGAFMLPVLVILMILSAAGMGMWLSALAIQYRDIKYAMNFLIQLLMYSVPVVYPATLIPEKYQLIYALNPMVGVIEGFRSALLGTIEMPWDWICLSTISTGVIFVSGVFFFRSKEKIFADVV